MRLAEFISGFAEELCDAQKYAEKYVDCKSTKSDHARNYYDMASDELKHAEYLHSFAGEEIEKLKALSQDCECYVREWDKANAEYADKASKVKWMLTL